MPTRIRLNNPQPYDDLFENLLLGVTAQQPNGFNTIKEQLDKRGARQILSDLQTQVRNLRAYLGRRGKAGTGHVQSKR
jgi:hypothetical protein